MSIASEIAVIATDLSNLFEQLDRKALDKLEKAVEVVAKSWSGSWMGYHSRVYYKDLQPTPPGAHFSQEWGLMDVQFSHGTTGEWFEYDADDVIKAIHDMAGKINLEKIKDQSIKTRELFRDYQANLVSHLSPILQEYKGDSFLQDTANKIKDMPLVTATDFVKHLRPSGQLMSRDMTAIQAGFHTPPHIAVLAEIVALRSPYHACKEMGALAKRLASHLEHISKKKRIEDRVGTNIFIGHGRSPLWKDLKDFVQDRLHLPWDEFNRVPVAGIANTARLSRMLDEAGFAFLIMTGEEETTEGSIIARMNVLHEIGLFQGRLGFERAIILLEEGCEEFSNIHGLGQIRFPKGNISAAFEEIRRVLEREKLIDE